MLLKVLSLLCLLCIATGFHSTVMGLQQLRRRSVQTQSLQRFASMSDELTKGEPQDIKTTRVSGALAETGNQKLQSKKGIIKRALLSSLVFSLMAFGAHEVAHAGILETLQEKAASSGFLQAFLLIFVSEIGDKTFFIAGLLAAKYSRLISFTGSIGNF